MRGTRLTRNQHAGRGGSSDSHAKRELLDASPDGVHVVDVLLRLRQLLRGQRLGHVDGAQERPAGLPCVLDLRRGQLRAADGTGSLDGVVEAALFEVHVRTVPRLRPSVTPINPAVSPQAAMSQ